MGGRSSHTQVQEFINQTVSNVFVNVMSQQTTVIKQSAVQANVIKNIRFTAPPPGMCPPGTYPKSIDFSQKFTGISTVLASMQNLDTMDLSQKITKELTAQANSHLSVDKKGIAFSSDSDVTQQVKISEATTTNINANIKNIQEKYISNDIYQYNEISGIQAPLPCGDIKMNQEGLTQLIAQDLSFSVTETIIQSDEYKKFSTEAGVTEKQTSKDTITSVADTAGDTIKSVAKDVTSAATFAITGYMIVVVVAIIAFVMALPLLIKAFGEPLSKKIDKLGK